MHDILIAGSTPLAAVPVCVFAKNWSELDRISDPAVNAAYLARAASAGPALREWLKTEHASWGWEGAPAQCPLPSLVAQIPAEARRRIAEDIATLLPRFSAWTGRNHVRLHFGHVRDDACRKFHVDFIGLRVLVTYVGLGTEWVENRHANREFIGRPELSIEEANHAVVPDLTRVHRACEGDVLVLKGEAFEGNRNRGAIHRSPPSDPTTPRFVLRIDVLQCGC